MIFVVRRVDLLLVTAKNATPTIERPASLNIPNASSKIGYYRESAARSRITPHYKFNVAINRNSPQPTSIGS